jgi:TadE-like protein
VLIEFALILPLFLFMVFLVIDLGRAINYWIDQTHLASEGARLAAVNRVPSGGDLKDYLRTEADTAELRDGGTESVPDPLQVCIDFPTDADGSSGEVGDPVKVTVRTEYNWAPILGLDVTSSTLVGSATHRLERDPGYSAGCTS